VTSSSGFGLLAFVLVACAPESEAPPERLVDASPDWDAICGSGSTCNPLTQAGCNLDEKCTWILQGSCGPHIGCTTIGTGIRGNACSHALGFDPCAKADLCTSGACRKICDHQGGEPRCDAGETCTEVDAFTDGAGHLAGACLP